MYANQSDIRLTETPPPYEEIKPIGFPSRANLKYWGRKVWIGIAVGAIIIVIAVIVGAVLGVRANAYPSYSKLSYSLQDDCMYLSAWHQCSSLIRYRLWI
jgi:hypothetical protein